LEKFVRMHRLKNRWREKIKVTTGWPRFTWNMTVKLVCVFYELYALPYSVVAWLSGSTLVSINEVTLPGPVSTGMGDCLRAGKPPRFVTSHSDQLSLLSSAGRKISTGHTAVTLCGWGVTAGMVYSTCGLMCGWQVSLINTCHI